jgi:hypothetical protein
LEERSLTGSCGGSQKRANIWLHRLLDDRRNFGLEDGGNIHQAPDKAVCGAQANDDSQNQVRRL